MTTEPAARPAPVATVEDDIDDDLLDDVLAGMTKPAPTSVPSAKSAAVPAAATKPAGDAVAAEEQDDDLDEDAFARELSAGMEQLMSNLGNDEDPAMRAAMEEMVKAFSGTPLPDAPVAATSAPSSTSKTTAAAAGAQPAGSFQDRIRQTMSKLEESDATAASTGAGAGAEDMDSLMSEMMRQMETLTESPEFDSVLEGMMESLMAKDILHEPLRDLTERYPAYLAENKDKLPAAEFDRYTKQLTLMTQVITIYEENAGSGEDADQSKKVIQLMTEIQELGQPPAELMRELVPEGEEGDKGEQPDCNVM